MTEYLQGIDVSHYQGKMNWEKAKAAGVQFAFIKATEGISYVDTQFKANVDGSIETGIPYAIYHFWRPLVSPLLQYGNIARAYEYAKCPIVIDVEDTAGLTTKQNMEMLVMLIQLLIDKTGKLPTIYTSAEKWKRIDPYPRWKELPLWVANYGVTSPALPRDWNDWMVWQYSSTGSGAKYGAESTNIDLDYVKPAYLEYYGIGTQPEPEPEPEPVEHDITITLDGVTYSGKVSKP